MNDLSHAPMGHNGGPALNPDVVVSEWSDYIQEAQHWADGTEVENDEQMRAVELLVKKIKEAEKAVGEARDEATRPLHVAWQAEIARWKPTITDLDNLKKCLLASIEKRKKAVAAKKAEEERIARQAAWAAQEEARKAAEAAAQAGSNIDAMREAEAAKHAAELAQAEARAAAAQKEKGLRTVTLYEITDHKALLKFIALNHRDDVTAFIEEWARKNHKTAREADGLRVWDDKRAY